MVSIHSILQLLVVVEESQTFRQVIDELESLLRVYRFDYYRILRHVKSDDETRTPVIAARWPDAWKQAASEREYALADPTVRFMAQAQRGFRWRDVIEIFKSDPYAKRMARLLQESRDVGLEDGYVFPVHGRTGLLGSLTLGGQPVDLSPVEMALFAAASKSLFWRLSIVSGDAEALLSVPVPEVQLTRREVEILHYLTDGMTSNEIGKILGISNHTVDWYMNSIQSKLGARNRQHAVALAMRMGLIS